MLKYFIDDMGYLWRGPDAPDSTMHYARFEGIGDRNTKHYEIWVLMRSARPENSEEVSREVAQRIIELYRKEAMSCAS